MGVTSKLLPSFANMKHLWLQSLVSHSPPITLSLPPLLHSSSYYPSRSFAQLQQPAQKLSQRIMRYAKKIQGVFFNSPPLKVLSVRLHSKSHQKSSKCQNLLTGWHLELLGGGELKKTPCP